ncbi:MAG: hypothetical protein KAX46_00090 [Chromatiaceae bacterium]|nr:hypothetical protein [Chromatiaceae bacterium]
MTTDQNWRLEQHVGTIMQVLIVALLGWSLKTNVETTTQIGVLQAEVRNLQAAIAQGSGDRYRASDAARDLSAVWGELNRHAARMDGLEAKHR